MYIKGIGIIIGTSYIFYETIWVSIIMSPYLYLYVKGRNKERKRQEQWKRTEEFKDGMLSVSFALHVGYSVENAFREAARELKRLHGEQSPTAKAFSEIVRRMNQNENLEDLLDEYANESDVEDIMYFAEVFRFAKRSGGNLIAIIRDTANTIREKTEISKQIQSVVSGKKMEQRVMSVIPFGIVAYLKMTAPELTRHLYGNVVGICVMTVCLLVMILSNIWAKRIVEIEV